jgi:diguanylate cyclase (GGDEF)-like protein/PAS domain S-box-containing protein
MLPESILSGAAMDTTSTTANAYPVLRRGRDRLFDRVNIVLLPCVLVLLGARHFGMISSVPAWQIFGSLLLSYFGAILFATRFPPGTSAAKPRLFLVLTTVFTGLFLYSIGWGAVLAVTFIASAAVVIEADGSRYGPTAIACTLGTILVGELAVTLGIFPSMIDEPGGHGLALLEAAITAIVIALLARGQQDKERAEEQQRQGEERFRALVQHTSDAILIIEDSGLVRYASPAVEHLFGCPPEKLESLDITWVDADHAEAIHELFRELRERPGGVTVSEVPIRRVDGSSTWVEIHITNLIANSAVGGYVCNMRDIGARRNVQMQLVHDAQHDPLTHLANRRLFLDRLDQAWDNLTAAPDKTQPDMIGVLFIDVDHFKEINDQLGHEVGDHVLVTIANVLSTLLRPTDLVARFGGDEFTVLLDPLQNLKAALEIAERIRTEVSGATCIDGRDVNLAVSVGVATSRDVSCATELLRRSDEAMYSAKRNGRARVESVDVGRLQHVSSLAHFLV